VAHGAVTVCLRSTRTHWEHQRLCRVDQLHGHEQRRRQPVPVQWNILQRLWRDEL